MGVYSEETLELFKKTHLGKIASTETRKKMSLSHIGFKHPPRTEEWKIKQRKAHLGRTGKLASNWQGGKTEATKLIRNSIEYKEWRNQVFKRDDYTCRFCKVKGKDLEAHHIYPIHKSIKFIYDVDNGITLCKFCHGFIDKKRRIKEERKWYISCTWQSSVPTVMTLKNWVML